MKTILSQEYENYELLWSSCFNSQSCVNEVMEELEDQISLCRVDQIWAVNQTFNKSCLEGIKHFGTFDGFTYMASDSFFSDKETLSKMARRLKDPTNGIIYPEIDNDSGLYWHLNFPEEKSLWEVYDQKQDIIIPLGATGNLHVAIFSRKILEEFGRPLVDLFTSYCSESIFTFVVAAIKQKMIICNDILVHHRDKKDIKNEKVESVDGQTKAYGARLGSHF